MAKQVLKNGIWQEGSAGPELAREDLRKLPANYVTKDIGDPDKIHELDAPHVVATYLEDFKKAEEEAAAGPTIADILGATRIPVGEAAPLSQVRIDIERLVVIRGELGNMLREGRPEPRILHLWFPEDNVNHYSVRDGNPPADSQRPKHMRGFKLEVDVFNIPASICQALYETTGVNVNAEIQRWKTQIMRAGTKRPDEELQ